MPKNEISKVLLCLRTGNNETNQTNDPAQLRQVREVDAEYICWKYISNKLGRDNPLVWIIALTAASIDGLSISSIKECLSQLELLAVNDKLAKPIWLLETLILETNKRLIFGVESNPLASYERTASEKINYAGHRTQNKNQRYMMDAPMAKSLMTYLYNHEPVTFRIVRTLISIRARQRADLTKLQIRWIYGTSKHHYRRDIQAYSNLIASLDPDDIEPFAVRDTETANILDTQTFSLPRTGSTAELLRYAYFRILRKDIDRGNRMSMVLDDDRVRLQLYLQLFFCWPAI